MKICHITSVHKLNDIRIFLKECKSLAKKYDVYLLGNDINYKSDIKDVKIINLNIKIKNRVDRFITLKKKIYERALEIDADIYHLHDPELLTTAYKLKKMGKKVIFDFHEDTPKQILAKQYLPKLIRTPLSRIYSLLENYYSSKLDAIVTATPYLKSKFIKINRNTIDVNNFPILSEFLSIKIDNEVKINDLIYIGGLSEERGLFKLIEIGNLNPELKIVICGHFISKVYEKEVKKLIKYNNIEFKGVLDRKGIQKELEEAKIGIVLLDKNERYSESLPIKMFEYMAAGLPVIASDFKLWEKILLNSNSGFCVNPNNSKVILEKISILLSEDELRLNMGKNGREIVQKEYNWDNEEEKLLNLYKKLEEI
ncbi:glycosyltransferase family 4 protein [Macrococcoides caseolyticum]|nr:glycosyltransferase [Macrococcus caseolyticus]RKO14954.1 glycosyltransferase [Macrococcus caseolyticus]